MNAPDPPRSESALAAEVAALKTTLAQLESERQELLRRRRLNVLTVGIGVSLLVHLGLMFYLATHYRAAPGRGTPDAVTYEFAIVQDEELTALESMELSDLLPEVVSDADEPEMDEMAATLDPAVAAAELEIARAGATPTLGGSGEGTGAGTGLAGGGAGASFFGVSSRGMRFAYIVDKSGSMGQDRKMEVAMQELARSVSDLPDFASFITVLFSSNVIQPPMQTNWMRARKPTVSRFIRWLNEMDPGGGTLPVPAFTYVFSLEVRPDVIFFLTDGQIPDDTALRVAELNEQGGRVVINTIAFGDARSQGLLKQIARESGGVYRFVPTGDGP